MWWQWYYPMRFWNCCHTEKKRGFCPKTIWPAFVVFTSIINSRITKNCLFYGFGWMTTKLKWKLKNRTKHMENVCRYSSIIIIIIISSQMFSKLQASNTHMKFLYCICTIAQMSSKFFQTIAIVRKNVLH